MSGFKYLLPSSTFRAAVLSEPDLAAFRYRFQGREYSAVTGLVNFRARWYAPGTGRWLSRDPIRIMGGANLYAFCSNSPVCVNAPFGEMRVQAPGWHRSGREAVYDGDTEGLITNQKYKGTYNYVNPPTGKNSADEWLLRAAGHFISDRLPYYILGNRSGEILA